MGLRKAGAGSDAAALRCKAELKAISISSTAVRCLSPTALSPATAFLAATTDRIQGYKGVINLIVDLKETPGFKMGKIEEKLGILVPAVPNWFLRRGSSAANLLGKEGQGLTSR